MLIPPRRIVLSGGGIRALAHLGALEVLETKGLLQAVKEYVGVSAGAFVGFSLMIGYTIQELKMLCSVFDFAVLRNLDPEAALEFPTTFGFDNGENLMKLLQSLLRIKKLSPSLTFEEWKTLHPDGPFLRCFATDLFTTSPREFSWQQTPTVTILDALRATMSLPAYFTPVKDPVSGNLLVDGGILHNFPLAFLPLSERKESLGISFSYDHTNVTEIPDLLTFFSQIFACYYIPRTYALHQRHPERCIIVPCGHIQAWNFEATQEEREGIMNLGKQAAEEFLQSQLRFPPEKKPIRRFSVS
jgi:predicted acylesterase/phospholipase RssA